MMKRRVSTAVANAIASEWAAYEYAYWRAAVLGIGTPLPKPAWEAQRQEPPLPVFYERPYHFLPIGG